MKRFLLAMMAVALASGHAGAADEQAALDKAKTMTKELGGALKQELEKAVKESGFAGAVTMCGAIAVEKAEQTGKAHGASIRRVSKKVRNPSNTPDALEEKILGTMEADLAAGALKEAYVEKETTSSGKRNLRFLKPIVTAAFCLNCHGEESKINPEALKELNSLYPSDKARGYGENQLRGAFSSTVALD